MPPDNLPDIDELSGMYHPHFAIINIDTLKNSIDKENQIQ
jgi:hypothetical protein